MTTHALCKRHLHLFSSLIVGSLLFARQASAEKTLAKAGDWEIYTDGRLGAFLSYTRGDGLPRAKVDAAGNLIHDILGGGIEGAADRAPIPGSAELTQGTLEGMRVRSGFIGNTIGLGLRGEVEGAKVTGYTQIWSFIESAGRRKYLPNYPDVRQAYVKVEGSWGSLLAGRTRALFSRGATDIDFLYGHRYGLGYPGSVDLNGPAAGHIGYGVLGSGFAAGFIYGTPSIAGLQLNVGLFDPIQLQGAWTRTKFLRPESELTFEQPLGDLGKVVLFGNGAYQPLYQDANSESTWAGGFGYGARLEVGPVHLGIAGHYGKGLGLSYALEASDATIAPSNELRKFDGYYVQSQFVLGSAVDLSAGWGITRVFETDADSVPNDMGNVPHSIIKSQMGISAGIVYHASAALHADLDYFRAQATWFLGEKQVVNFVNAGLTFTW